MTYLAGTDRLLEAARRLEAAGQPFAIATVVSRQPPVSAQVGDKAIIGENGELVAGWIGGNCSQPVVRREAQAAIRSGRPRLLRLTAQASGGPERVGDITTVAMTCPSGGEVEIYIEPHLRRPRLVAAGATPLVAALARMAPVLGFEVFVAAEPAEELDVPSEHVRRASLSEVAEVGTGGDVYHVVASMGRYDEDALAEALRTDAPYIALIASRRRSQAVLDCLRGMGCGEAQIARIRTPAGISIGAVTQEEIALSVLAEIVSVHRQRLSERRGGPVPLTVIAPATARDPVCGMEVEIEGARHVAEHGGKTYYFCCPHCRQHFLKEAERYLSAGGG